MILRGLLKSLITQGVSGVKTLITNARVGKQVLASGATVTMQQSGSGTNTLVSPGGSLQVPIWVYYIVGALLIVPVLIWAISKLFKK